MQQRPATPDAASTTPGHPVATTSPLAAVAGPPGDDARATLTLDKTSYAPGEAITVTYSGMLGDAYDYISTAKPGTSNNSYIAYKYTAGAKDGVVTLKAPSTPGSYEMRAFFREDETILRARVSFEVR